MKLPLKWLVWPRKEDGRTGVCLIFLAPLAIDILILDYTLFNHTLFLSLPLCRERNTKPRKERDIYNIIHYIVYKSRLIINRPVNI